MVHYGLLLMGQTFIVDLYLHQLECVQDALQQKKLTLNCKGVHFLYGNVKQVVKDST